MATFKYTQGVGVYHDRLVGGMVRRGYDPELAERVFKQIEGFGSYGFPESHAASFAHLAYASSWLKCHHPAVFAAALLNSQPMGFYAPAQIVGDASKHDVEVRPLDINASDWDCTLEPEMRSADQHALRLGSAAGVGTSGRRRPADREGAAFRQRIALRVGRGSCAAHGRQSQGDRGPGRGRRLRKPRFQPPGRHVGSQGDRTRRAAFAAAGGERTSASRRSSRRPPPALPAEAAGQSVVLDYTATGLTLRQHPLALLRPALQAQGYHDTRRLNSARAGSSIRLPGIVLMRQRPGTAKGIVFMTLEDEFGVANLVVYTDVGARDRAALIGSQLLVAEGPDRA